MLERTSFGYMLAGFHGVNCSKRREGEREEERGMEERKELKKIGKLQVSCGEERKEKKARDSIFVLCLPCLFLVENENLLDMFGQLLQIFYQTNSYLVVLVDEM